MKKTVSVFILSVFLTIFHAQAQTETGRWLVGGNFAAKKSGKIITNLDLNLNTGYFINNNFALGLRPEYQREKYPGLSGGTASTLALGAFGRYYFLPKKSLRPILDLNIGYLHTEAKTGDLQSHDFYYYTRYGLGLNYFFNEHVALEGLFRLNAKFLQDPLEMFTIRDQDLKFGLQVFF